MDLQMPEMNGFDATEYIRTKMNSKVPIIALTADVTLWMLNDVELLVWTIIYPSPLTKSYYITTLLNTL